MSERTRRLRASQGSNPGTFSIVGRDPENGSLGVAIATGLVAAGASAPFVSAESAVSTQAFTEVSHGRNALELVEHGLRLPTACDALLRDDDHASYRQLHGVDAEGRQYVYTGEDCVDWCGHRTGDNCTVAGNMLVGEAVIESMDDAFETANGSLAERLLTALEVGEEAGGDKRGSISAALLVSAQEHRLSHDLRVDSAERPVEALRDLYRRAQEAHDALDEQAGEMLGEYPDAITEFRPRW